MCTIELDINLEITNTDLCQKAQEKQSWKRVPADNVVSVLLVAELHKNELSHL